MAKQLTKRGLDDLLVRLAGNTSYIALLAVVVLAALDQAGIDTTSALAIFGAAGLAVGLAVKDSLSNFAAGVMIAFFHPFKLGHYIEAAGTGRHGTRGRNVQHHLIDARQQTHHGAESPGIQ